ncbi:hypothetical protein ACFL3I_11785 [Pseudomonadota bacterium]
MIPRLNFTQKLIALIPGFFIISSSIGLGGQLSPEAGYLVFIFAFAIPVVFARLTIANGKSHEDAAVVFLIWLWICGFITLYGVAFSFPDSWG